MINNLVRIVVALIICNPFVEAYSQERGHPTDVYVEVGKVTQVEFPDKVVKVVKGGTQNSVLVEVLDNSVYLLPKMQEPADVFVTTTAGDSYPLNLKVSESRDIKIQVGSFKKKKSSLRNRPYTDVMELMKDLLLEKEPVGSTVILANGKVLLSNQQMSLTVQKAYEMLNYNAYILVAKNLINNAVIIPIEQINLPNLVAISSDRDMISAKGQEGDTARVYIIVGKSDEYRRS